LMVFLGLLASATQRAQAGCGDYVMVRGVRMGHHSLSGTPLSTPGDSRGIPNCTGPRCQRHVPLPLPPEPIVSAGTQDTACPSAVLRFDASAQGESLGEPALLRSQVSHLPPEHPPRQGV
jgi:hypothetical protein